MTDRSSLLPALTLRQIQYFVTLAHARSFTQAAQSLALTQPALTAAIRQIEFLLGGPLFGAAGWAWWRGPAALSALGTAALPAAFLAEAAVAYAWRLHYWSSAVLFAVLGVAVFVLAGLHRRQYAAAARWLLAAFPAGVAAELLLGLIYSQSF